MTYLANHYVTMEFAHQHLKHTRAPVGHRVECQVRKTAHCLNKTTFLEMLLLLILVGYSFLGERKLDQAGKFLFLSSFEGMPLKACVIVIVFFWIVCCTYMDETAGEIHRACNQLQKISSPKTQSTLILF